MKELDIKIGYACNNACLFCLNKDKRYYKEFPVENLKRQIDASAEEGCEKLIISGGEPLISRDFLDLMSFAKRKGIKNLEIQTNGRMLYYEGLVKKIKEFGSVGFLVSLHFPNAKLYKKYCQSEGFYQVIRGIKNLVKHRCNFTVNTVIMKPNLPYLEKLIGLLKRLEVKKTQYRFIDGRNVIKQYKAFVPKYSEAVKVIQKIVKQNPDFQITLNEIPICVLGEQFKTHLAPVFGSERLNLSIGNKIFTSEEIKKQQFIYPNCRNCIYKLVCNGVRKEYVKVYGIKEFKPKITNN